MKEISFIKSNAGKWKKLEDGLKNNTINDPDQLAAMYIELTDDLAYAKTKYKEGKTVAYLNGLASSVHQRVYRNRKEKKDRFAHFWLVELPLLMAQNRQYLLYSFVVFLVSAGIGVISAAYDDSFVRLILGDRYVDMTLENIDSGDPMAVYKSMHQAEMFLGITFNNIRVSFLVFAFGVMFSAGTFYLLMTNGIMLGSFQYFFYDQDLLLTSFLTIWIHGTLEISAIIIAGCGGVVMGNSILFPGTYSRMQSFQKGALKGMKIVIGVLPLFIVAGFLESFVTRLTGMHDALKLLIIILSALFVVFYFIVYPSRLKDKIDYGK
ncbi:stage II sporulation protein M [Cytophagaceae bacterium ABcell3]|nr:stage II sporulation protein M [Cytophagaceae bacterium ABcell3]